MANEEAIKIIEYTFLNADGHLKQLDFDYGGKKGIVEALRVAIDALSKPSLPSNLDEAAEEFAYTNWESEDYHTGASEGLPFDAIGHTEKCFKAGAKWMAGQGVNSEGKVFTSAFTSYVKTPGIEKLLKDAFPEDTEVIVQIRKKQ